VLFLESFARPLLVLHAVLGAATVAVSTHLCVWIRAYPRGEFGRHGAARWFATAALILYALQFLLGNGLYPTYKVRVRSQYFDDPAAVLSDAQERQAAARGGAPVAVHNLSWLGRLFDVKEHWAALGLALASGVCALAWAWDPRRDGPSATLLFVGLSVGVALCAWVGALVGLYVASYRAVGGLA
jgi:hypothetical protein